MVLAGIDEAGYGPLLGPLVVGSSAFEFDADPSADLPCLWSRLKKQISKNRSKTGRKLHVNDSKMVYSPSVGLKELERSVLAFTAAKDRWPAQFDDFLSLTAAHAIEDLAEHGWYDIDPAETFPLEQEAASVRVQANGLRAEMDRTSTHCIYLHGRVIPERQYNRIVQATRNKSSLLFSTAALHLDHLLSNFGTRGLVIFCDRQGVVALRTAPCIRLMFDDWSLEVTEESDGYSEYRLLRGTATLSASSSAKKPKPNACPSPWRPCSANTCANPHEAFQFILACPPSRSGPHRRLLQRRAKIFKRHPIQTRGTRHP